MKEKPDFAEMTVAQAFEYVESQNFGFENCPIAKEGLCPYKYCCDAGECVFMWSEAEERWDSNFYDLISVLHVQHVDKCIRYSKTEEEAQRRREFISSRVRQIPRVRNAITNFEVAKYKFEIHYFPLSTPIQTIVQEFMHSPEATLESVIEKMEDAVEKFSAIEHKLYKDMTEAQAMLRKLWDDAYTLENAVRWFEMSDGTFKIFDAAYIVGKTGCSDEIAEKVLNNSAIVSEFWLIKSAQNEMRKEEIGYGQKDR